MYNISEVHVRLQLQKLYSVNIVSVCKSKITVKRIITSFVNTIYLLYNIVVDCCEMLNICRMVGMLFVTLKLYMERCFSWLSLGF